MHTVALLHTDLSCVTYELGLLVGHDLVENMVTPLRSQLKRYSGFFQQVCEVKLDEPRTKHCMSLLRCELTSFNVGGGQFPCGTKVDSYEFALKNKTIHIKERGWSISYWHQQNPYLSTHETGRVIIPDSFGIPKGLQQWVSRDDLVFQIPLQKPRRRHMIWLQVCALKR